MSTKVSANNLLMCSPPSGIHPLHGSRREFFHRAGMGLSALALQALAPQALRSTPARTESDSPARFPPRAKRIIWLCMDGGLSHLDSFDPKPRLQRESGKPFPMTIEATQFDSNGPVLGSPWKFSARGQSGLPISTLFPHLAGHADDLAVLRSMTTESSVHANAQYWLHTGWGLMGRPSAGAWISYGLGTESSNLPGYVVLNGGLLPIGGIDCYRSGFLPAAYSATVFAPRDPVVANIQPANGEKQRRLLRFTRQRDEEFSRLRQHPDELESAI